jgi:hypothetical protein
MCSWVAPRSCHKELETWRRADCSGLHPTISGTRCPDSVVESGQRRLCWTGERDR